MKRLLFHGSEKIIQKPYHGGGKPYNDYGRGFYCTESIDAAREWSVDKDRDGFVSKYEIDETELTILNLNSSEFTILHWLQILLENRLFDAYSLLAREAKEYLAAEFRINYQAYDVMIGYRADDSYFSFAQDFLNGAITLKQLQQAMHLGKLGEQYVLKRENAFAHLTFLGYEPVQNEEWYIRKRTRDRNARKEYFDMEKNRRQKGDWFITDIIDMEIKSDDERLR